jgi:hypothetical protein
MKVVSQIEAGVISNQQVKVRMAVECFSTTVGVTSVLKMDGLGQLDDTMAPIMLDDPFAMHLMPRPEVAEITPAIDQQHCAFRKLWQNGPVAQARIRGPHHTGVGLA